jgi:Tfp pilus assembly protein PilV
VQNHNHLNISNVIKPILVAVFFLILGVPAIASGQTRALDGAQLQVQSSAQAKRTIDQVERARIEKVRDVKFRTVRADMLKAYDAIKAIADNKSTTRTAGLLANLKRLTIKLKGEASAAGFSLNDCNKKLEDCKILGGGDLCELSDEMCIFMAIQMSWLPPAIP